MTNNERVAIMRRAINDIKIDAFNMIRILLDCEPCHCGYKDHEDMIRKIIAKANKDCDKIMKPFDRGDYD